MKAVLNTNFFFSQILGDLVFYLVFICLFLYKVLTKCIDKGRGIRMSLTWEEISLNQEMILEKNPIEKVQLVKYAGASGDFNMIHQDEETALKVGLPKIIAHGMLSMGFLGEHVKDIAGDNGFVRKLKVQFRDMVFIGDKIICKAIAKKKDEQEKLIDLDILAETAEGRVVTKGSASIKYY